MAWLKHFETGTIWRPSLALSATVLSVATLVGCNVGKTDTVTTTASGGTTTTTTGASGVKSGCYGTFEGGYNMPDHETRVANRNQSLMNRGINPAQYSEDENNRLAGGGPPDGGIWLAGSMSFETDANCNVISGKTYIFFAYEYDISGTVNKDGTFDLVWSGQGSAGQLEGRIEADGSLSGTFHHPAPDTFVHGDVWGTFTPKK